MPSFMTSSSPHRYCIVNVPSLTGSSKSHTEDLLVHKTIKHLFFITAPLLWTYISFTAPASHPSYGCYVYLGYYYFHETGRYIDVTSLSDTPSMVLDVMSLSVHSSNMFQLNWWSRISYQLPLSSLTPIVIFHAQRMVPQSVTNFSLLVQSHCHLPRSTDGPAISHQLFSISPVPNSTGGPASATSSHCHL